MKKTLHFRTPAGKVYTVSGKGELAVVGTPYSGDWLFLGLQHVNYNIAVPFVKLTEEFIDSLQLKFKNGNPRFTVSDIDHGTHRLWGNTKYHGVSRLWYE